MFLFTWTLDGAPTNRALLKRSSSHSIWPGPLALQLLVLPPHLILTAHLRSSAQVSENCAQVLRHITAWSLKWYSQWRRCAPRCVCVCIFSIGNECEAVSETQRALIFLPGSHLRFGRAHYSQVLNQKAPSGWVVCPLSWLICMRGDASSSLIPFFFLALLSLLPLLLVCFF